MERLEHLIGKLKEQFEQNVEPLQILITVKLIEAELANKQIPGSGSGRQSTKVAVVLPPSVKFNSPEPDVDITIFEEKKDGVKDFVPPKQKQPDWGLDPLTDIPTLSHQTLAKELNDVIGNNSASLNDQLKEDVLELAASLKDTPVRELKKAIGVNDRYAFINELFRGDEAMYERSIKTINNFRILPEAEYWMERELKIKLGWDDGREITKQFYQLVKRRFS